MPMDDQKPNEKETLPLDKEATEPEKHTDADQEELLPGGMADKGNFA
jgi:hypothetical protein